MDGRKTPVAVHRIRSENKKRNRVSLDVRKLCFIFFMERIKNGITHGNIPTATERTAIKILTLGLP